MIALSRWLNKVLQTHLKAPYDCMRLHVKGLPVVTTLATAKQVRHHAGKTRSVTSTRKGDEAYRDVVGYRIKEVQKSFERARKGGGLFGLGNAK
jgi:hypothetical protein